MTEKNLRLNLIMSISMAVIIVPSFSRQCDSIYFIREIGFALEGHVVETHFLNPDDCIWRCRDVLNCFSVNSKKIKPGEYLCEINNSTKEAKPESMRKKPGFEYRGFPPGARHSASHSSFRRAIFPDGWYLLDSALYKLINENKTWHQARQFCQSIDAELATITSQQHNGFIYENLLQYLNQTKDCKKVADIIDCWYLDGSDAEVILRNGATYKRDNITEALYLDGNGGYADTPAVSLQFPAFTITCWVKVLEPAKTPGYIYADWSSPHQFSIWVHGDWKTLWFQFRNKAGTNVLSMYTSIPYNVWFHVAVTWDQVTRLAQIFIDGQPAASKVANSGLSGYELMSNSHSYYQVGSKLDSGETFYGFVRNLKVFKRILSDNEIQDDAVFNLPVHVFGVWISLNDIVSEGNFVWSDGSSIHYTNWRQGQPNENTSQTVNHDCVAMISASGKWTVTSCYRQLPFVCQKKII